MEGLPINASPLSLRAHNEMLKENRTKFQDSIFITDNWINKKNGYNFIEHSFQRNGIGHFLSFAVRNMTNPVPIQIDILKFIEDQKVLYKETLATYTKDPNHDGQSFIEENKNLINEIISIATEKFSGKTGIPEIFVVEPEPELKPEPELAVNLPQVLATEVKQPLPQVIPPEPKQEQVEIPQQSLVQYKKGETKTRNLVPTVKREDGGVIGKGNFGIVHLHRDNAQLVVKKSHDDLTKEFEFARNLKHPCLVEMKRLFVKLLPNDKVTSKLVMEKIVGQDLTYHYHAHNPKLTNETTLKLLEDAKNTLRYLDEKKVVWADLNSENVFVTPDGHMKLCDYGFWQPEDDSLVRSKKLLLGAMQLVGWLIKSSNVRRDGKDLKLEDEIMFPSQFFKVPCTTRLIYTATVGQGHIHHFLDQTEWLQAISKELSGLDDKQKLIMVEGYLDSVIASFKKVISEGRI